MGVYDSDQNAQAACAAWQGFACSNNSSVSGEEACGFTGNNSHWQGPHNSEDYVYAIFDFYDGTCPEGSAPDEDGRCIPVDPEADVSCNATVVKETEPMLSWWHLKESGDLIESRSALMDSEIESGVANLNTYQNVSCIDSGHLLVSADENLFCGVYVSHSQSVTADGSLLDVGLVTAILDIDELNLSCPFDVISSEVEPVQVSDYMTKETQTETDENQDQVVTTKECYKSRIYDVTTNSTQICDLCFTTVDDGVTPVTISGESCSTVKGDATLEGAGSGTEVACEGLDCSNIYNNAGDINISEGGGEGEGFEPGELVVDFREIIEDWDGTGGKTDIDADFADLSDNLDARTAALNSSGVADYTAGDVDGIIGGSGVWSDYESIFPGGEACQDIDIPLGIFGESVTLPCSTMSVLRDAITFFMWLYVLMHIRSTIMRPSTQTI